MRFKVTLPNTLVGYVVEAPTWLEARADIRIEVKRRGLDELRTMCALDVVGADAGLPVGLDVVATGTSRGVGRHDRPVAISRELKAKWNLSPNKPAMLDHNAQRFVRARHFRGMNLQHAADVLGMSVDDVAMLENGRAKGDWDRMIDALRA